MDFDHDMDDPVLASPSQISSGQWHSRDADADLVKWQGSQTSSIALNALMKEAAKPVRRSPRNQHGSSLSGPFGSFSPSIPSSNHTVPKTSLRVPRSRKHISQLPSTTSSLTSTPASSITSDPTQFLQTLKGVSEKVKVNETARAKKRLLSGEVKEPEPPLGPAAAGIRMRHGREKENLRRSATGAKGNDKRNIPFVGHRSLPNIFGELKGDGEMEVEVDDASFEMDLGLAMDMDTGSFQRQSCSRRNVTVETASTSTSDAQSQRHTNQMSTQILQMPPPPVPVPKIPPSSRHATTESPALHQSTKSVLPSSQFKLDPPLNIPPPQPQPPPSISRPPSSQVSSHPRALGMRRPFRSYSTFTPSQTLPEKQRGFKVPLAKPISVLPPAQWSAPILTPCDRQRQVKSANHNPSFSTPESSPVDANGEADDMDSSADSGMQHRSSSPVPDADSSYGEISFDMDALEETMKKYD